MNKLKEKIEKSKQLVEELKLEGLKATLDEETGEITIKGSEFTQEKLNEVTKYACGDAQEK